MSARPVESRQLPISSTNMEALIALYLMQPGTAKLIAVALTITENAAHCRLKTLVEKGLASRSKAERVRPTDEEQRRRRLGFIAYTPIMGRRPYVYTLSAQGLVIAEHLHQAGEAIRELRSPSPRPPHDSPEARGSMYVPD